MPSLTINGHSVTVDDSFDKLSPEQQNATVDHIAKQLHEDTPPSGVGAGLAKGMSDAASGIASTLGLAGVKSEGLDKVADAARPDNYKAASLIRDGGHWYNPSDYQPSAIPQMVAEQAPGLAVDMAAAKAGSTIGSVGGIRGKALGGTAGFLGSMLLRTFGPGAHANAEARTGDANAPVESGDMLREAGKQALMLPINATAAGRFLPSKVAGVGVEGGVNALKKYLTTAGVEELAGHGRDAVDQAVTNVGQEHGKEFDANRNVTAGLTSGATGAVMVAPRFAGDLASASKFREFGGDNAKAAAALADRQLQAADGKNLVGPLGGTRTAAEAVNAAHSAVHNELKAATADGLSTDTANVLQRIKDGGTASQSELRALDTEAPTEVAHLARQAMLSSKLKSMGNMSDDAFTGGISGTMEKRLKPFYNPTATLASAGAGMLGHAGALGTIGMSAPHVLAGVYGSYLGARALDKLTGSRSPAVGFTDKFGGSGEPIRTPTPPTPMPPMPDPKTTSVPQVAPPQNTQLWGAPAAPEAPVPSLKDTLLNNVKLEEGMAKIAKQVGAARPKPEEPAAPEPWSPNPTALKMLQSKLKAGLPPEPPAAPPPAPAPEAPPVVISPIAQKMLQQKLKQGLPPEPAAPAPVPPPAPAAPPQPSFNPTALTMLKAKLKQGLPPVAPPVAPEAPPVEAAPEPSFHPTALKMLQRKLKQGLPAIPQAAPETAAATPSNGPASQAIGDLMAHLRAKSAPPAPTAPPPIAPATMAPAAAPPLAPPAPEMPQPPMIAKITKKLKGKVEETPHPQEAIDPETGEVHEYTPQKLYGKDWTHEQFATHETAEKLGSGELEKQNAEAYHDQVVHDRMKRERELQQLSQLAMSEGDVNEAKQLLQELHHIRRGATAEKAIAFHGSRMSPGMKAASQKLMKGPFHKMWSKYE